MDIKIDHIRDIVLIRWGRAGQWRGRGYGGVLYHVNLGPTPLGYGILTVIGNSK